MDDDLMMANTLSKKKAAAADTSGTKSIMRQSRKTTTDDFVKNRNQVLTSPNKNGKANWSNKRFFSVSIFLNVFIII